MIMMFCEALRFTLLYEKIVVIMGHGIGNTGPLHPVMWQWINNWKTLSGFALDCKDREDMEEMADDPEL